MIVLASQERLAPGDARSRRGASSRSRPGGDRRARARGAAGRMPARATSRSRWPKPKALVGLGEQPGRLVLGSDSLVDGRRPALRASRRAAPRRPSTCGSSPARRCSCIQRRGARARRRGSMWSHVAQRHAQVRELSEAFIEAYLDAEWPAVGQCVGVFRIEARGVQLFEAIEGDISPCSACRCCRCSARCASWRAAGVSASALCRSDRRSDRPVEVAGDPQFLARQARHRCRISRAAMSGPRSWPTISHERRADADWRGCNVTMPHKQAVMPLLDRLDPLAERIGAVNTVVREADGSLTGYNTDVGRLPRAAAAVARARSTFSAWRACSAPAARRGRSSPRWPSTSVTIVLAGRDPAKARALLDELDPQRRAPRGRPRPFRRPDRFRLRRPRRLLRSDRQRQPARAWPASRRSSSTSAMPRRAAWSTTSSRIRLDTPLLQARARRGFRTDRRPGDADRPGGGRVREVLRRSRRRATMATPSCARC